MKGFTLIEVLLTISLVAIAAMMSSIFYGRFIFSQSIMVVSDQLEGSLREAQAYSMAGKDNVQWGVAIEAQNIILFQGDSFATRDREMDTVSTIDHGVTVAASSETVFARMTGVPDTQTVFVISDGHETKTYTLGASGALTE